MRLVDDDWFVVSCFERCGSRCICAKNISGCARCAPPTYAARPMNASGSSVSAPILSFSGVVRLKLLPSVPVTPYDCWTSAWTSLFNRRQASSAVSSAAALSGSATVTTAYRCPPTAAASCSSPADPTADAGMPVIVATAVASARKPARAGRSVPSNRPAGLSSIPRTCARRLLS